MSEPEDRTNGRPGDGAGADEPVGSVGEEAAKLLGAFSDWAKDHGAGVETGLSGLAGHAASAWQDVNEHVANGSPECTYCPICRTVHAVRQTSPEVRAHLATAAAALMQAAAGIMATQVPPDPSGRGKQVERIDLDDDLGPEGEP